MNRFTTSTLVTLLALTGAGHVDMAQATKMTAAAHTAKISNHFGMKVFQIAAAQKLAQNQNMVYSPISTSMAFSMIANGANGATAQAFDQVVFANRSGVLSANAGNEQLLTQFNDRSEDFELKLANGLFVEKRFPILGSFLSQVKSTYRSEIANLDFLNPNSADVINQWASDRTNGKINQITSADALKDAQLLLANATYFKADWASPFRANNTYKAEFLGAASDMQADYMHQTSYLRHIETDTFEAIDLPYGASDKVSMTVVLPKAPLADFLPTIDDGVLSKIGNDLDTTEVAYGSLALPKFKVEAKQDLVAPLKALGLGVAFSDYADFSGLSTDMSIKIGEAFQKVFMQVDEKGTEAAAVTVIVGVETTSIDVRIPSFNMNVNRPFLVLIRDKVSGAHLFVGAIANPQI